MHDAERRRPPAARHLPEPAVQERLAGMRFVRARPLDAAERLEARVAHAAREVRRDDAELVPDLFGRRRAPVVTQPLRDLRDDPQLVSRAGAAARRLAHALHPALAVGDGALAFAPGRRGRQHDVRELRRLREERFPGRRDDRDRSSASCDVVSGRRPTAPGSRRSRRATSARRARHRVEHLRQVLAVRRLEWSCPTARRSARAPRDPARCPGSRAACWESRPCRRRPARCSGRAADCSRSPSARRVR